MHTYFRIIFLLLLTNCRHNNQAFFCIIFFNNSKVSFKFAPCDANLKLAFELNCITQSNSTSNNNSCFINVLKSKYTLTCCYVTYVCHMLHILQLHVCRMQT